MKTHLTAAILFVALTLLIPFYSYASHIELQADIHGTKQEPSEKDSDIIEIAGGKLRVGMTKIEAFEAEGVPYRVKRLPDEEDKEMWIYRCMNDDGFNEDCLYLYFDGDTLKKIDRP